MEPIKCNLINDGDKIDAMRQFANSFGGEETLRRSFPKTYAAYQQTLNPKTRSSFGLKAAQEPSYDIDILHASYVDGKKDKVAVIINSDFNNKQGICIQQLSAINRLTQEVIASNTNSNYAGYGVKNELIIPLNGCDPKNISLNVNFLSVNDTVAVYGGAASLNEFKLDCKGNFDVTHPKRTHSYAEDQKINISYYRSSAYGFYPEGNLDYFYPESWEDNKFRIPNEGLIKVEETLTSINRCSLKATNSVGDTYYHSDSSGHIKLTDSHTIAWKIPTEWGFEYQKLIQSHGGINPITYELSIHAICENKDVPFTITNKAGTQEAQNIYILPKIMIYTDCFEEGTEISMANGATKKVEWLTPGDLVICGGNQNARVRATDRTRKRASLTHIILENNTELFITQGHKVETEKGLVAASLLTKGDKVETKTGWSTVREIATTAEKECNVIVVSLESTHRMFANGILVGDSEATLTKEEEANNIRLQIPEEWRTDYDSWVSK